MGAKENTGLRRRQLRLRKAAFLAGSLVFLVLLSLLISHLLTSGGNSSSKEYGGREINKLNPDLGYHSALRVKDSDYRDGKILPSTAAESNFCEEFAISGDEPDSFPQIAIFHHTTTKSEFAVDTPTHTGLQGVVDVGKYEYFQICVAKHHHHHKVSIELNRQPIEGELKVKGEVRRREERSDEQGGSERSKGNFY